MTATAVYTDGACLGNPGPGGWAWAVPDGLFASGAEPHTTNQRMEIAAALQAVTALDGRLEVVSDSTYVVNCFRDRWWEGWIARGWRNAAKKPVANRDLWEPLIEAVRASPERVTFRWVKGHGTDRFNDLVDRLAVEAARTQAGRSGTGTPADLGAADQPYEVRHSPATGRDGQARPAGHLIAVCGHRPPGLGGYDANPVASDVARQLQQILAAKREMHPDATVLTGLSLGAEQLAAEAAVRAGVPYVAVLPYPEPDSVWPPEARRRYQALVAGAITTIVLDPKAPASRQHAAAALRRRDSWLARHADEAVVVWDGEDAAVGRLVRSFQDTLGETGVWVVKPGGPLGG